ncbi:MAG: hypothetical protein U9N03_05445 [Candidatus Caldatribacteriota bacterium]|nr:hypothetical protein [Candidatus Caldatribacteriota bacterium]
MELKQITEKTFHIPGLTEIDRLNACPTGENCFFILIIDKKYRTCYI